MDNNYQQILAQVEERINSLSVISQNPNACVCFEQTQAVREMMHSKGSERDEKNTVNR